MLNSWDGALSGLQKCRQRLRNWRSGGPVFLRPPRSDFELRSWRVHRATAPAWVGSGTDALRQWNGLAPDHRLRVLGGQCPVAPFMGGKGNRTLPAFRLGVRVGCSPVAESHPD